MMISANTAPIATSGPSIERRTSRASLPAPAARFAGLLPSTARGSGCAGNSENLTCRARVVDEVLVHERPIPGIPTVVRVPFGPNVAQSPRRPTETEVADFERLT